MFLGRLYIVVKDLEAAKKDPAPSRSDGPTPQTPALKTRRDNHGMEAACLALRSRARAGADCYLISTFAPTSSNFFLIAAASSLVTASLIALGAPSTRSLASLRPRLVTSRTTLITLILFEPTSV